MVYTREVYQLGISGLVTISIARHQGRLEVIFRKGVKMSIETQSMHITPVGGNVFADLGFTPEEAAVLKAESQKIISEKLVIKDSLITEFNDQEGGWIDNL